MASKKEKKAKKKIQKQLEKQNRLKKPAEKKSAANKKFDSRSLLIALGIVVFTFAVFSSAINNEFVNWDDDRNFYENENITTLNKENFWSNTKKIFTSPVIGGYNPLSVWTFAIEHQVYGFDKPEKWHLTNVILHAFCTFFVFFIGRRLGLGLWASVLFALLFGIHPMRVESVAWVTERKDVLFGFFYLLALLYYLKYIQEDKKKLYIIIIWVSFILSLFSKIQAVILPVSMVLIDYYFDGKLDFKKILRKTPYFLGSFLFGVLGIMFLGEQGSLDTNNNFSGVSRLFIGSYQYTVYLIKSIVPYRLSPLYPYPASLPWYTYVSMISFLLTGLLMWRAYTKQHKVLFFGLGFFVANVFFLLQILGAGQGYLADRFTYIAYIGLFFIYAYYFGKLLEGKPNLKIPILATSALLIAGYSFITFNQNKIWENSGTLWSHVLQYYKKSTLPYGNRANYYRDSGKTRLALIDYNERIKLKADDAAVFNSRARLFFNSSNRDTLLLALQDYNKAIELKGDDAEYWVNRGASYAKLGDYDNALVNLNEGIRLDPNFVNAYLNRSVIYNQRQDFQNALSDITKYLEFKPYAADMWYEKSRLHNILGQGNDALAAANRTLQLSNKNGLYYIERAKAYYLVKDFAKAKTDLSTAQNMGIKPSANLISTIMGAN